MPSFNDCWEVGKYNKLVAFYRSYQCVKAVCRNEFLIYVRFANIYVLARR